MVRLVDVVDTMNSIVNFIRFDETSSENRGVLCKAFVAGCFMLLPRCFLMGVLCISLVLPSNTRTTCSQRDKLAEPKDPIGAFSI